MGARPQEDVHAVHRGESAAHPASRGYYPYSKAVIGEFDDAF